jgi:hypothetical protein
MTRPPGRDGREEQLLEDNPVRRLYAATLFICCVAPAFAADPLPEDSVKAAATRKLLKQKVTFNWKDTSFGDIIADIKEQVKGLGMRADTKGGVNLNKQITFSCKDIPLEDAIEMLLAKANTSWGYIVESQKGSAYDGLLTIRVSKERGWKGVDGNPTKK